MQPSIEEQKYQAVKRLIRDNTNEKRQLWEMENIKIKIKNLFHYRKIWSLNPNLYKLITFKELEQGYLEYVQALIQYSIGRAQKSKSDNLAEIEEIKTLSQWLETEI